MKSRPMLYQGAMVRAILDDIKTQTRRIAKIKCVTPHPQMPNAQIATMANGSNYWLNCQKDHPNHITKASPYGQVGDRLWVRETCRAEELSSGLDGVRYLADEAFQPIENTVIAADLWCRLRDYGKRASPVAPIKTVPAIHMPRWASRIELEITGIRIERLNDISEADADAEGVVSCDGLLDTDEICRFASFMGLSPEDSKPWYAALWEQINGPGSWAANPWVWVIEFKKI